MLYPGVTVRHMQWWNDIIDWLTSRDGREFIATTVLPFLAILIGGIIAGLIARGAIRRLMQQHDRQHKAAAVASLIAAGRRAARWTSLTAQEKEHVDFQVAEAEVRVRMLPVAGADLAAEWAAHQLVEMKRNSANFSFQAEQDLRDFQNGLIAWQTKPSRARKLFAQDLAAWRYDDAAGLGPDRELDHKQQQWVAENESSDSTAVLPKSPLLEKSSSSSPG
jgi:hypothetical protein